MLHTVGPWEGLVYYTHSLAAFWAKKMCFSGIITVGVALCGGDALLLWLMAALWAADFAFGLSVAIRRRRFRCRMLARGVLKAPAYCLYLLLVGVVQVALTRSIGADVPLLNMFVAYLIMTDAVSVMAHMQVLGLPVPGLLRRVLFRGRRHLEKTVDRALGCGEDH